jgi:hypothetical protein
MWCWRRENTNKIEDISVTIIWWRCKQTACVMLSPVNVTTHFNCSGGAVNTNLSCFCAPSLPHKGTGNRRTHSCKHEDMHNGVTDCLCIIYEYYNYSVYQNDWSYRYGSSPECMKMNQRIWFGSRMGLPLFSLRRSSLVERRSSTRMDWTVRSWELDFLSVAYTIPKPNPLWLFPLGVKWRIKRLCHRYLWAHLICRAGLLWLWRPSHQTYWPKCGKN